MRDNFKFRKSYDDFGGHQSQLNGEGNKYSLNPDTIPSTWDDPADTIAQGFDTEFDTPDISTAPNAPNASETELPPIPYTPQHNSGSNDTGCAKAAVAFGIAFAIFFVIAFVIGVIGGILGDIVDVFGWEEDTIWDDYIQTWGIVNEGGDLDDESAWVMMVGEEWEGNGVEICLSSCEKYLEQDENDSQFHDSIWRVHAKFTNNTEQDIVLPKVACYADGYAMGDALDEPDALNPDGVVLKPKESFLAVLYFEATEGSKQLQFVIPVSEFDDSTEKIVYGTDFKGNFDIDFD